VDGGHLGPRRLRLPRLGERAAQHQLVLRVDQRIRAGRDPVTGPLERVQVRGRHVLVVEGHDGGAVGEALEGRQVAVVTDPHVGGHERRGLGRIGRQHPQGLPEGDRRLVRHPGQLPAADHRHDGRARARVEGGSHGGARLSRGPIRSACGTSNSATTSTVGQRAVGPECS
jgi:hypothetical protein